MNHVRIQYFRDAKNVYQGGINYATEGSVGMDLRACLEDDMDTLNIEPGQRAAVPAGIAVEASQPENAGPMVVAGFVYSRSGLGAVKGLTVAQGVGVIDPDYRGEIVVFLLNTSDQSLSIKKGERIAQLVFQPVARMHPVDAETLTDTSRGGGGFGHTGQH